MPPNLEGTAGRGEGRQKGSAVILLLLTLSTVAMVATPLMGELAGTRPWLRQNLLSLVPDLPLLRSGTGLILANSGAVAAPVPPPIDKGSDEILSLDSSGELIALFDDLDYSFTDIHESNIHVPRLFLAELPGDISSLRSVTERKQVFFGVLLPVILRINEQILQDRARLRNLHDFTAAGGFLTYPDQVWLRGLSDRYGLDDPDFDELLRRVDVVPPSMALAQAAVESGWGTSRLARESNALFGQMARLSGQPSGGSRYAAFDDIMDSAAAYVMNLNRNAAYDEFRALREAMRASGDTPAGGALMAGLDHYSELGHRYITYIRGVIDANELGRLDGARLMDADPMVADATSL